MLQVRKNEISLRQWSGYTAQLRTFDGTLIPKYALCWQQRFFSHSIKVCGLCYQQSLAAYTCQDVCVQQSHAAKRYWHNSKWTFEDLLPCYCYATNANSRTVRSQVSQFAFAGKGADLVNCKPITAWYQNSEHDSCALWVSYR